MFVTTVIKCHSLSYDIFNPETVFWTNVGKIVLIYFLKILPLI